MIFNSLTLIVSWSAQKLELESKRIYFVILFLSKTTTVEVQTISNMQNQNIYLNKSSQTVDLTHKLKLGELKQYVSYNKSIIENQSSYSIETCILTFFLFSQVLIHFCTYVWLNFVRAIVKKIST